MMRWFRRLFMNPEPPPRVIECRVSTERVFLSFDDSTAKTVELNAVLRVVAWKRDRWSFDEIMVTLELVGDEEVDICEDAKGYKELLARLESALPGFSVTDQWWDGVAFPAFEENMMVLWEKTSPLSEIDPH